MFYNFYSESENERYFIDYENSYFTNPNILENSFHRIDNSNIDGGFFSSILDENDKDLYFIRDNKNYFDKDIKFEKTNSNIAGKQTNYKTEVNQLFQKDKSILKNEIKDKVEESYKLYSFEKIKKILEKNGDFSEIISKFEKTKYIDIEEKRLCNKKRKREFSEEENVKKVEEKIINEVKEVKRGRKSNGNKNREEHNKMSPDNIIKKIKSKAINYLVKFMNNMIDKRENETNKFYKLNYNKYINNLNRNFDLQLLKMEIEELLSMEISPKYKNINSNFNQSLIEKIKNKEEYVKEYNTVIFLLKLKFEEWLSLFTFKKSINEIIKEKGLKVEDINIKKIQNSLNGTDQLLRGITKEKDLFVSNFIFLLYNYERWFFVKTGRSKKYKNE